MAPSNKELMLAGDLYLSDDPELLADHERARLVLERFNATSVTEDAERRSLLRQLLAGFGEGAEIKPPLQLDYGHTTTIGARTFVNYGAVFLDCAPITIGEECLLATNVQLLTATHPLEAETRRAGVELAKPITIGDGVWLGGGVIVCPGVTIGENTVIGAGSVVTKDIPTGVVAVGNPARVLREL